MTLSLVLVRCLRLSRRGIETPSPMIVEGIVHLFYRDPWTYGCHASERDGSILQFCTHPIFSDTESLRMSVDLINGASLFMCDVFGITRALHNGANVCLGRNMTELPFSLRAHLDTAAEGKDGS